MKGQQTLIYDGDCGICLEWIHYWQKLTGKSISYHPYQEVHTNYPDICINDFKKAIQYIDVDDGVRSGASATFAVYKNISIYGFLDWLYFNLPGFAFISEYCYKSFSRNRRVLRFFTHLFWGKSRQPSEYKIVSQLFLRALACIYLAAFGSLAVQILGLIGSDGILPLQTYLPQLEQALGNYVFWKAPTLFWFMHSDIVLQLSCIFGLITSCLLLLGFFQRIALFLSYLLYLSLYYAGQTFMSFQWDLLLLETGFLAIFLCPASKLAVYLYRWLLFRFMFLGGLVKLISQDPSWDKLTALNYHFETQPLPTVFAWYAHHLPEALLMTGVALTLIIELILPIFIFSPRRIRMAVAFFFLIFQCVIILTGNYNFFNLLTMAICLFLFDDAAISSLLPSHTKHWLLHRQTNTQSKLYFYSFVPIVFIILISSFEQLHTLILDKDRRKPGIVTKLISPWNITQNYGPFAVMTTVRREIIIEGSRDGDNWQEYHFKFKPGDISLPPRWATPHQPKLDWQMWFAALSPPERNPWFTNLLYRLLLNSEPVTELLASNPFPDIAPVFIRARLFEYHLSSTSDRKTSANWWRREFVSDYYPAIRISTQIDN